MTALSHLFVHVADLARTRAFYVDKLGLTVLMEHPGYLRLGGGAEDGGFHLGIEQRDDPAVVGAPGIEIVIRVADVDAAHRTLTADGVKFDSEPADMPWGARHAWLTDPDGYRLSLYS